MASSPSSGVPDSARVGKPGEMPVFDASFVAELRAAEDRHFWFVARNKVIAALAAQIERPFGDGYRVLEIGCSSGNTLRAIAAACRRGLVVGVDLDPEGLSAARDRSRASLILADARDLPFAAETRFDLICAFDVIEHVDDDAALLAMLRSQVTSAGALLITVPAGPGLWSWFDEVACHRRRYTAEELTRRLIGAGFHVEFLTPFMAALHPLLQLTRYAAPRPNERRQATLRQLKVVAGANGLMSALLSAEVPWIRARRRLPFGTSLVAIARPAVLSAAARS